MIISDEYFDFWRWLLLIYKFLYKLQRYTWCTHSWFCRDSLFPFPTLPSSKNYLALPFKLSPSLSLFLSVSLSVIIITIFSLARFVPNLYLCLRTKQIMTHWKWSIQTDLSLLIYKIGILIESLSSDSNEGKWENVGTFEHNLAEGIVSARFDI